VLIGNAMDDPKIISIGLPVVAVCFIFGIVFNKLKKKA
jgi:hypothetical protein